MRIMTSWAPRAWRWWNKNLIGRDDFGPYGEPYVKSTVTPIDYALHVQDPYAAPSDIAAEGGEEICGLARERRPRF